jgi:hypothetical protein
MWANSSIVTNAALLKESGLWEEEIVNELVQASSFLSEILNNTLDISKLEHGEIEFNENYEAIRGVVDVVLNVANANARKKGIRLNAEYSRNIPPLLKFDKGRLVQVVMNLVNNAIKFTPEGGQVSVLINWLWSCGFHNGDCSTCAGHRSPIAQKLDPNNPHPTSNRIPLSAPGKEADQPSASGEHSAGQVSQSDMSVSLFRRILCSSQWMRASSCCGAEWPANLSFPKTSRVAQVTLPASPTKIPLPVVTRR